MDGVFSGVQVACVIFCAVRAVASKSVYRSVGNTCAGSLLRRYAPWSKISWLRLHLLLNILYLWMYRPSHCFPYISCVKSVVYLCVCSLDPVRVRFRGSACVGVDGVVWLLGHMVWAYYGWWGFKSVSKIL